MDLKPGKVYKNVLQKADLTKLLILNCCRNIFLEIESLQSKYTITKLSELFNVSKVKKQIMLMTCLGLGLSAKSRANDPLDVRNGA